MYNFLKSQLYKATTVHNLLPQNCKSGQDTAGDFKNKYLKGFFYPKLMFYYDKAWYTVSRYVNSQNNRNWRTENPYAVHDEHDLKVGVW
jgi:hypothetical protein